MAEFAGRVAVVTGSSSGIGAATARQLSKSGATVVVNSSESVKAGTELAEALPGPSLYVRGDISKPAECQHVLDATISEFGQLDLLVNNAGWTTRVDHTDLEGLTDEIFQRTFDVNVFGTWAMTKAAIPMLRSSTDPNIVTITSIAGLRPMGSSIAYSMAKAALNQMTRLLARSYAPIRVNAVAPGLVMTPWTEDWPDQHEAVAKAAPLGRSGTPEDCAEAVMALLRNRYATGQILTVDGGITL